MAQATKLMSGKHNQQGQLKDEITVVSDENEEIQIIQRNTYYELFGQVVDKVASTRMGQVVIGKMDRVLKIIEDTAKWSLPQESNDIQLQRPLPWIFFLTLIIWLRVLRMWLSISSYIVRSQFVTPHALVYYIQSKRRHLRAVRIQGLRTMRNREIEATIMFSSNKNVTFIEKLRKLFSSAICKPRQYFEVPAARVSIGKGAKNSSKRPNKTSLDHGDGDPYLTVYEMLELCANEDSDNDSDYIPKEEEEDDESSTSHTSSSSAEDTEKENPEKANDTPVEVSKSQGETKTEQEHQEANNENGEEEKNLKPKCLEENKTESPSPAVCDADQMNTTKETTSPNGPSEDKQTSEMPAATTEVASPLRPVIAQITPKVTKHDILAALEIEENKLKATPGHESAASVKASQTSETKEAQFPTLKEVEHDHESTSSETSETRTAGNQKKHLNHPTTHQKQNHQHHHNNAKNRNKNRR